MPRARTPLSKAREIIRLTDIAGLGQRQISRTLGISRPVVDHYQKQIASVGLHWQDIAENSDEQLLERIEQSEQRANDPRYVELVQRLPRIVSELSMHLEHTAGEALFIDYAGQSPVLTDPGIIRSKKTSAPPTGTFETLLTIDDYFRPI